ncbi:SRF-TF-domain-containing protein [Obba rivulosa]|uniref:SRF-TF-domain-containing protein n=1 Tax=Obba rivulosa TaxID=1052685 RepID=A0A8E2AXE2_9APHY|nr:SRF-TF-domain-containing protein [Obba rivulosa]
MPNTDPASPSLSNKRQRLDSLPDQHHQDDTFINDHDAAESPGDDDDDDEKPKSDKKAGRRKIKIEFIQDKSRRHITFSKRKAGIMKKAYELSTLTGTQVLLLVVSETGLVYTFTTAKLQPLVTQPEGKNLIQACLNAPHGTLPSSMPVGTPLGRTGPMSMPQHHAGPANVSGSLSISGGAQKEDEDDGGEADEPAAPAPPRKRRRASSSVQASANASASARAAPPAGAPPAQQQQQGAPQTSPQARAQPIPPLPVALPAPGMEHSPRHGQPQSASPQYTHANAPPYSASDPSAAMYPQGYPPQAPPGQSYYGHDAAQGAVQNPGMAPPHGAPWGAPPVQQSGPYGRR